MSQIDDFLDGKAAPSAAPKVSAIDAFLGEDKPKQNKGLASDVLTAVKQGALQLPGVATGILDIAPGALGIDRPASKAADFLGSMTGFQPGKWAKEANAEYSPETQQAKSAVDQAWDDPNKGAADVAAAYLQNPRTIGLAAAQSVPSMLAGGLVGRGLGMAAGINSAAARAAIGEGAVMAGSTMDQIDASVDPQKAAAASLVVGAGGAAIGAGGAKIASRFGNVDIDSAIAGGVTAPTGKTMSLAKRVPAGILQEGLLEEAPQSALETGAQNWAEGKPLTEGMARNVTEGALAGGLMGGGAAALTRQQQAKGLPDPDAGQPPAQPPAPALGYNPKAGTHTVFPDGTVVLNSETPAGEQAVFDKRFAPQPVTPTFASAMDADNVYQGWSNVRDGSDRQAMADQIAFAEKTYGGKVNDANIKEVAAELGTQFKWFRAATPQQRVAALNALRAPQPVTPSQAMGIDPNAGAISRVAAEAVDGPASMEMAVRQAERDMAALAAEDNPEAGADPLTPAVDPLISQVAAYAGEMGTASPQMVAAKFGVTIPRATELLALADPTVDDLFPPPQGAANVSNTDAAGTLAAGTGGRVGADATGSRPDAGLLEADAGQRAAGDTAAPGPVVSQGDAAPVPGQQRDPALTAEQPKPKNLKEAIARKKAERANVQDQPQATTPAAAPAPTTAVQAPQAVGSDGAAQSGAAPTGRAGVEADVVVPASTDATGKPASWVIRNKDTGEVVMETFDRAKVQALNTAKYEALPVQDYLASLNKKTPAAVAEPAATTGGVPESEKAKWIKATIDKSRLNGAGGVQIAVAPNGGITFMGDPRSNKDGKALLANYEQALAAGATQKEIAEALKASKSTPAPSTPTTEPTNAPRSPEAAQAVETTPQGREEAALLSDSVSTEPNLEAAKALLTRQKAATGNAVAEGKLRKELRDLAAKTPETDAKTMLALDTAATRLGMGEGKLKGLEFMPAESSRLKRDLSGPAPAAAPAVAAPAPTQQAQAPAAAPAVQPTVAQAANEAATSPANDLPEPTQAQKEAGNYKKGHVQFDGLDLTVENPVGSTRSGMDPSGKPWEVTMTAHYGYHKRTTGADGDQVDVYLADNPVAGSPVFVFDQFNADGSFDEHKAVAGVATEVEAIAIYDAHFSDGSGPKRRRTIKAMTPAEFKAWAMSDAAKQPLASEFIPAPDGGLDYGEITPEMGKAMRRQAGKIRLTRGVQNSNGTGHGLVHIEANHGKDIRALGFTSIEEFVAYVAGGIQQVWQVPGNSQLLVTTKDGRKDVMYIRLEVAKEGDFYRVNSAFPVRQQDYEALHGMKKIWDGSEPTSAVTGQRPAFATAAIAAPDSESSQGSSNARGQADSVAQPIPEAQAETPKLTQAEAKDLMEWQDLGQKDGIKTHILTFYESKADKDAKRGRMTIATVSKEVDSKTWVLESNGEKYAMLGFAKKRAEEAGMARAVADGFVEPAAAAPMSKYDAEARTYGYQVAPDGKISKGDKALSPVAKEVRGRLRVEAPDGKLLFSGATTPEAFGEFLRSFWGAEKTAQPTNDRDTFTLERLNPDTDRMEPVTFQRGETVKIAAGQRPYPTGVITGISHAERKFRVDGNEYGHDFGYAYKADFDELALPRQEVDASLNTLEQRLNEGNAIQSEGFIRSAKEVIERNNLGDYAKDRMAQLARRAADVSKSVLDKMRAAQAEKEQADAQKRAEDQAKAAEPKPPIEMTMDEWKAVSKDFKGMIDGKRTVMRDGGMRFVTIIPSKAAESKTPAIDAHNATMAAVREGKATAEQFKASFEAVVDSKEAIKAELDTMTKVQLLREGGPFVQMRYANEKKAEVVDAVYRQIVGEYALGETVSYGMGKGAYEAAIRRMVDASDDAKLAAYVAERKAAIEEAQASRAARAEAIENPQTLNDYREAINVKVREGMTRKDAYLTLTPEQRIKYDTLEAEGTREAREARKRALKTQVRAADQTTGGQIIATKHTKNGYDLFVVQLSDRLSREDYQTVLASAKKLGGWYSAFRGNGAVPGFQFKDRANADAFLALAGGDTAAAQEQVAQRRDAFEDDRSQTAVERLRAMADKLDAQAAEVEGRERKTNTARRARFASAALNAASADKAKAKTMRNIADGIEAGKAKFLDEVRTKSQVDMLTSIVDTAKGNELRAKYPSYADQEKRKGEPPTAETADFAEFPSYGAFRSDLATLGRQLLEVDGTKKLGQRLMSVADDVTDAYLEFAKANFRDVSQFGRGDSLADFASKDEAERAIKRSGLTGKAIVLPIKRGQNRVILSPSEAIGRGVWQGDGDKRITLTVDFGNELVEAIGRRGNKTNKLSVPWQFQNAYDRRKALARIGIETPSEYRSALREFINLKEQAVANRTRELELQMVGRKADGLDFFPTSAEVADQMVEAADLSPDMAVLEPSAGMGHLADRIREAGAEPDVIEISPDRRELLEEKGYHLAEVDDFMQMEPRKFFTYGDVFRAPDGTEGIMRGGNSSMGSDRVMLVGEDGRGVGAGFYNRSELVGVRHRGTDSGYDRIIMNPPFSNRRDAEHVRHAYDLLKPGGRIVAIMGEGVFFGQDKKAQDFRDWLDSVGGTSEKLPEGSFMDPSLPVNTAVNARMVVIDKPAANTADVVFAQSLAPVAPGQGVTRQQAEEVVEKALDALGMRGVVTPQVVQNTLSAGLGATPPEVVPSGGNARGQVYLFLDGLADQAEAFRVVFHELFHLGLSQSVKPAEYTQTMLQFLRDPLVREYANRWKQSADGKNRLRTMPMNNWHALAVEEALADIAEEMNAERGGIGTKDMQGWVKRTIAWLADTAQKWGLPAVARRLRGMTYTQAEAFVQATMLKARTGAPTLLPDTRFAQADGATGVVMRSPRELAGMATDQLNTALKSVTITSIKQAAGYKATDLMGIALGGLGRRQLVEIYGKDLPLDKYNELATQMEADKNEYGAEADSIATEWGKLKDEGALANIMHDATLAKIDPDKPLQPGDDPAAYNALKMRFGLMSKEAKETYRKARDGYKRHHANVREAIKERIERSQMSPERRAALVERMDSEFFAAMKGVYFPLARFGKYVVVVRGADGKVETVARSETMAEAAALRRNLVAGFPAAKGYQVDKVILSREFVASRDAVGRGFMQELYQVLDKQDMDPAMRAEMEDTLGQLYLSSLPDVSWAKHGIHRKGTPGFSQDARRAFAQNMFHGARYLAKLRYSDLMQTELKAMQDHVDKIGNVLPDEDGFNGPRMQRVVDEFYKRHDSLMNPNSHPLSTALTSVGFMFHLGLSPASALVNLTQTAFVAYPVMAAKWGFGKAGVALLKASKQAAMGRNDITKFLNRDERRAYDEAVRAGTIDVTMAHDLAGIAQGEDAGVMWRIRPAMRAASFLFHHAERFNRQATFVAAYRLAREAGAAHEAAFEQATKATYDGHFDYSSGNRPRFMQGNAAKVILLFKSYAQNMVYTLARNAYQSVNGLDPKERAEARKALAGILATHAMAAGVLGLPMVTTILAAISAAGSDDDEPFDAQVALQNMLADTFGQKPAEVITRGLSRLTPWDISGRVGLDRLIFPDIQEGLEGQRLAEAAAFSALGPVVGIFANFLKGVQEISEGHMLRGITTMMPAALRGPLNAVRLSNEGAQDKTGITIVDEVDAAAVFGQALGFSPSVVRQATEGKRAVLSYDRALNERRQELMTQYARGAMKQDAEAMQEAREAIQAFNEKNPGRRITMMQLNQSVRNRERRINQADDGVYLPKNRREAMEQGRFALTE